MKKKNKESIAEVFNYISTIGNELTMKEFTFVNTIFYVVQDNYSEEQYYDIIQSCCETIFDWRDEGLSNRDLFQKMLKNVYTKIPKSAKDGITLKRVMGANPVQNEECFDATECLRGLLVLFDMDEMDKVKDEIFLRVLTGEDVKEIADMYHTTEKNVNDFYNEKLAVVQGIRKKNGKVYVDGLENYSERLNNKLSEISAKIYEHDNKYNAQENPVYGAK